MAIKQLSEEQVQSWTLEQKDRWWLEKRLRGDMPQLTARAGWLSGVGIGLAAVIPFNTCLAMFLGSLFFWLAERRWSDPETNWHKMLVKNQEPICAGLIAGGALMGISIMLETVCGLKSWLCVMSIAAMVAYFLFLQSVGRPLKTDKAPLRILSLQFAWTAERTREIIADLSDPDYGTEQCEVCGWTSVLSSSTASPSRSSANRLGGVGAYPKSDTSGRLESVPCRRRARGPLRHPGELPAPVVPVRPSSATGFLAGAGVALHVQPVRHPCHPLLPDRRRRRVLDGQRGFLDEYAEARLFRKSRASSSLVVVFTSGLRPPAPAWAAGTVWR